MVRLYVYRARLERVVDGDTFDVHIDPGFHLNYAARIRLNGWDAPELRRGSDFEKEKGREATTAAESWFQQVGERLLIETSKADSFGRWLGEPFSEDPGIEPLGGWLAGQGLASQWPTRWRDQYDAENA